MKRAEHRMRHVLGNDLRTPELLGIGNHRRIGNRHHIAGIGVEIVAHDPFRGVPDHRISLLVLAAHSGH
jgi:hypothetical protein